MQIVNQQSQIDYFLGDALGSVRQMTADTGAITYARSYDPYGVVAQTAGASQTAYGYTSEWSDPAGMVYLRARHYAPSYGRFLTKDSWQGDYDRPLSLNRWMYVEGNPVNLVDSSGHFTDQAISNYLVQEFGNEVGSKLLDDWKQDWVWWNMMSYARSGDMLFGAYAQNSFTNYGDFQGQPVLFTFFGFGESVLTGVKMKDLGNPWAQFDRLNNSAHSLEVLRSGNLPKGSFIRRKYLGGKFVWAGFFRWNFNRYGPNPIPSFYVRPGLNFVVKTTPNDLITRVLR